MSTYQYPLLLFCNLQNPIFDICHIPLLLEYNNNDYININNIEKKMLNMKHPTGGFDLKKVDIDQTYPRYIIDNKIKLKDWIV